MPTHVSFNRIKYWVRMRIHELGVTLAAENIHLISSKNEYGIKKLASAIRDMAKQVKKGEREMYVIGCTNTGKSTFINSLIRNASIYEKDFYHDPFKNKLNNPDQLPKDFLIDKDQQTIEENKEPEETETEAKPESKESIDDDPEPFKLRDPEEEKKIELTSSPYPGTTLRFVQIEDLHLGWKIYDTPGVPNLKHITTFMDEPAVIPHLLHQKRVNEQKFQYRNDTSLWIGAMARLDYKSGDEICAVVYASNLVSLHKTRIQKSNELYLNQHNNLLTPVYQKDISKVEFVAHQIEINCDKNGIGDKEVDIYGLCWIGFYSHYKKPATATFTLYLPKNVGYSLREALINVDNPKKTPIERWHVDPSLADPSKK